MMITTEILFEGTYDAWSFKVNSEGYVQTEINGKYSDTLYDIGKIQDIKHLERVVKFLLNSWKVEHKGLNIG